MILDFDAIPEKIVPHLRDGDGYVVQRKFSDERMGGIVHVTIPPGSSIGPHTHLGNCEIVAVLAGSGLCTDDGDTYPVSAGMFTYCPEGHSHGIANNGTEPLVLLGVLPDIR